MRKRWAAQVAPQRARTTTGKDYSGTIARPSPQRARLKKTPSPEGYRAASGWKWGALEDLQLRSYVARGFRREQIAWHMGRSVWIIEQNARRIANEDSRASGTISVGGAWRAERDAAQAIGEFITRTAAMPDTAAAPASRGPLLSPCSARADASQ